MSFKEVWVTDGKDNAVYLVPMATTMREAQDMAIAEGLTAFKMGIAEPRQPIIKPVAVDEKALALCVAKGAVVGDLTLDEMEAVVNWCGFQRSDLWDGLTLQEILNVYRISAEYETWEGWAQEDRRGAHVGWNRAVIHFGNRMAKD